MAGGPVSLTLDGPIAVVAVIEPGRGIIPGNRYYPHSGEALGGAGNPCPELNLDGGRGARTRTANPWSPRSVLIWPRSVEFRKSPFVAERLEWHPDRVS